MADNKKWRIEGLSLDTPFCDAGKIVLRQRIDSLFSSIKAYFESDTPGNLHSIRIALRRLRYSMEIFYDCFNRKKFSALYKSIEHLQELSGQVRDLDVMKGNITILSGEGNFKISKKGLSEIEDKRQNLIALFNLELMKFYHSKSFKKFL